MRQALGILLTLSLAVWFSLSLCDDCWLFSDLCLLATGALLIDYLRTKNARLVSIPGVLAATAAGLGVLLAINNHLW